MVSDTLTMRTEIIDKVTWGELIKGNIYGTAYLFILTITGIFVVTAYDYFFPIDVNSEISVLTVAILFAAWIAIDFGLIFSGNPTPTLIAILIIIAPILVIYKLLKSNDLVQVDRSTPTKLKRYIPLRFITD